jgi:hypothetical protein
VLFAIRQCHYTGLLRQTQGYYGKYKTAFLNKNSFDVLFLGSSRAEMHYDTGLFDSLTHRNSFNLGISGATPNVAFMALTTYLAKSKAPAYIIYEVDYHALKHKSEIREFGNFFPFLSDPVFRKQMNALDPRMNHFYYNPYFSFPFTGLNNLGTSLNGWMNIENKTDSLYYKGFFRDAIRPPLTSIAYKKITVAFDPEQRAYYDSIITTCRKHNIYLTMISSPVFAGGKIELDNKNEIVAEIKDIAIKNNIRYFDLSSLPFCYDRQLFADHFHLRYNGARKFTFHLARVFDSKIANQH